MQFSELPVGAKSRFFRRGLWLIRPSQSTYAVLAGQEHKRRAPMSRCSPRTTGSAQAPRAVANPNDVELFSEAVDALEAQGGKTPEWRQRQALRRLDALSRLNTGG